MIFHRIFTKIGLLLLTASFVAISSNPALSNGAHGISIDGSLKYPDNFKGFTYTSPEAKKGGELVLHGLGSFDKMNPYTLKGSAPDGLSELVFETLAASSLDEPFAAYGLIAQNFEIAKDKMSMVFTLNPLAAFSDGTPITSEDVHFSLETFKSDNAHPFYAAYYQDISRSEIIDTHRIRFHFAKTNREIHMIAGQLPILSKIFYEKHPFNSQEMAPPVGSGPYIIKDFRQGKSITYTRNPNYWGRNLPSRRGQFNFDTITFKYFKDQIVSVEAFKANEFDFMPINIAKQWARDLKGKKYDSGLIRKEYLAHKNNAGMQGFVFNIRRPIFHDRNVRKALGMAFDFERTNKTLFLNNIPRQTPISAILTLQPKVFLKVWSLPTLNLSGSSCLPRCSRRP